jgi:APA family basic amino acid/polyamine antiporter
MGQEPSMLRYRMPGFPVVPAAFMLAALYVVIGSIASNPANAVKGTALILLGIPVFLFWRERKGGKTA